MTLTRKTDRIHQLKKEREFEILFAPILCIFKVVQKPVMKEQISARIKLSYGGSKILMMCGTVS